MLLLERFARDGSETPFADCTLARTDQCNQKLSGSFFRISTHSTLMLAGGERTRIPRGLAVTEPYDSLSVVPTILALTGDLQGDNRPVEALARRRFVKFPGRVIPEIAGQNFKLGSGAPA